jgi:hypothetical protein
MKSFVMRALKDAGFPAFCTPYSTFVPAGTPASTLRSDVSPSMVANKMLLPFAGPRGIGQWIRIALQPAFLLFDKFEPIRR